MMTSIKLIRYFKIWKERRDFRADVLSLAWSAVCHQHHTHKLKSFHQDDDNDEDDVHEVDVNDDEIDDDSVAPLFVWLSSSLSKSSSSPPAFRLISTVQFLYFVFVFVSLSGSAALSSSLSKSPSPPPPAFWSPPSNLSVLCSLYSYVFLFQVCLTGYVGGLVGKERRVKSGHMTHDHDTK